MKKSKVILLVTVAAAIAAFFALDAQQYLTRDYFQSLYSDSPALTLVVFFAIYVAVTALSLPGAVILTVISGAIFGLTIGLILISFASTIGATLAFLISRNLLREWVQNRFGNHLETMNKGIEKDGLFYLLTLRLIPAVPFFVTNLVMGLTPMKARTFYWVSQLGMLAGTAVYVNAGAQLGQLQELSVSGILTPGLVVSLISLGVFPWLARQGVAWIKKSSVSENNKGE